MCSRIAISGVSGLYAVLPIIVKKNANNPNFTGTVGSPQR